MPSTFPAQGATTPGILSKARFLRKVRNATAAAHRRAGMAPLRQTAPMPAYLSKVRVERVQGPLRLAYLPVDKDPVKFSTHGEVAAHYGAKPGAFEPHATTLDYVVAAAAG